MLYLKYDKNININGIFTFVEIRYNYIFRLYTII